MSLRGQFIVVFFLVVSFLGGMLPAMAQKSGVIRVVVKGERGEPLPQATVYLLNDSGDEAQPVRLSDENGRADFAGVREGNYVILARHIGKEKARQQAVVGPASEFLVELVLKNSEQQLSNLVVRGKSETREAMDQPIKAAVVNTREVGAQHTVTIEVTGRPQTHASDPFFLTGSFQRWQPSEAKWQMKPDAEGRYVMKVPGIRDGFLLEFKFTRGSWQTLESTPEGRLESPRTATIKNDTTIRCVIDAWRDDFAASTASPQVTLLSDSFDMPELGRTRRIWIYLPKDYAVSGRRYPVLYMQDGQDLFDEATSEGRIGPLEWSVDETLDRADKPCIVVAVDHHPDRNGRIKEYYVRGNEEFPEVEGEQYLSFLVNTLKPYIDKNYRTLPDSRHTALAGSSMGGLFTFYAALRKPDVFGVLGVLSPSIWLDYRNVYTEIEQIKKRSTINKQRYFFYAGGNESRLKPDSSFVRMHDDVAEAMAALKTKVNPETKVAVNPAGRHGAVYWRMVFPELYAWMSKEW